MSIYDIESAPQWELADKAANHYDGVTDPTANTVAIVQFSTPELECGTCGNTNPYIIGAIQLDGGATEDDDVFEACYECEELSHIADALISENC